MVRGIDVANWFRHNLGLKTWLTPEERLLQQQVQKYWQTRKQKLAIEHSSDLTLTDGRTSKNLSSITSDDILGEAERSMRMLISGDAGSGKDYVIERLEEKLRQDFDYILPADFAEFFGREDQYNNPELSAVITETLCNIPNIDDGQEPIDSKKLLKTIEKILQQQSGTLVIINSADRAISKVPDRLYMLTDSISELPNIIVATRPDLCLPEWLQDFPSQLTLEGFNRTQVREYIRNYFANDTELAAKVIALIDAHPQLSALSSLPLQLNFICEKLKQVLDQHASVSLVEIFDYVLSGFEARYTHYQTPSVIEPAAANYIKSIMQKMAEGMIKDTQNTEALSLSACRDIVCRTYRDKDVDEYTSENATLISLEAFGLVYGTGDIYYGDHILLKTSYSFTSKCWKGYFAYKQLIEERQEIPAELQYFVDAIDLNSIEPSQEVITYVNQLPTTPVPQSQQESASESNTSCHYRCQYPRDPMVGMLLGGAAGCVLVLSMGIPATSTMGACVILSLAAAGASTPPAVSYYTSSSRGHSHQL